ncbi:MAG: tRNA pseudouridine(38-40) synthase TruA, partial [Clostridia bacterium]|nr:tRNA pseudouridine(38-40) synthase TruA [Clostridia bacterium]
MFTVSADGFLYNMVRIMTGTLADVAYGKIKE